MFWQNCCIWWTPTAGGGCSWVGLEASLKKSSSKSWRKAKSWRKTKSWRKASPSFGEKSWTKILKTKNLRADTILSSGYHTEKWKPKSKFLDRRMFWSFRFLHRRIPDETRASQSDKFYIFYHPTEKLYHIFTKVRNQIKIILFVHSFCF